MVTMHLPIPAKKQEIVCFFVPYTLKDDFINNKLDVTMRPSDSWLEFRNKIKEKYGKDVESYTITRVADCNMKRYFHTEGQIDQFTSDKMGQLLLYEVDPNLKRVAFPDPVDKYDSNNGIDKKYTRVVLNQATWKPHEYRQNKIQLTNFLPRLLWVDKSTKLSELHLKVFEYMRWMIAEWIDWKDPNTTKVPKEKQEDLRKALPALPFKQITKQQFMALPL